MSDYHFGYDNDLWVYPPLDDDWEMPEQLEAVRVEDQLFVDADDAIAQVRALQAENEKLRDFIELLLSCPRDGDECKECRRLNDLCVVELEAGKLGIEV